jgi:hypothetical protein
MRAMINNFDDFDSGRMGDLSFDRGPHMGGPPIYFEATEEPFILLTELREALIGVVEGADTPPRACYSLNMVKTILCTKHNLTEELANFAADNLKKTYLGPTSPYFLNTSIVSDV